ncbi:hypothetical protein HGA13_04050 [Nocardia speluncae]|uniref:Asparagine synthetase domain-containing protein n=1 Tax=Nocardia speluncae TaxID=419477 RepID=A0A846XBT8_9NOCA|nr:hypothetical protein [Nocardia speluncae]
MGQRLRGIESPPTAVLSGGIDSSSVTVLAAEACGAVSTGPGRAGVLPCSPTRRRRCARVRPPLRW